jgi:hypothetical protein
MRCTGTALADHTVTSDSADPEVVMAQAGDYRIRWANVSYGHGRRFSTERMCIAERKTRWLGWWPVIDGDWRFDPERAQADIRHDRLLRDVPPKPTLVS